MTNATRRRVPKRGYRRKPPSRSRLWHWRRPKSKPRAYRRWPARAPLRCIQHQRSNLPSRHPPWRPSGLGYRPNPPLRTKRHHILYRVQRWRAMMASRPPKHPRPPGLQSPVSWRSRIRQRFTPNAEPELAQDTPSATRDVTPVSAEVAEPGQPNEHNSAAVPAVAEPELAQDTSSVSDAAEPAPAQQQEPALLVQEVTKKPENPRRGWWQRLIQS